MESYTKAYLSIEGSLNKQIRKLAPFTGQQSTAVFLVYKIICGIRGEIFSEYGQLASGSFNNIICRIIDSRVGRYTYDCFKTVERQIYKLFCLE